MSKPSKNNADQVKQLLESSSQSIQPTRFWHLLDDGRVQCDLCPRYCKLKAGQRGLCFVRACLDDEIVLTTYGRSSGYCVDPIEKKPLNHFLPGTPVLSFGTAGCNLTCKFCQNWDISKSREFDTLADAADPNTIAQAALRLGCRSVAFTYNDPVIFHEYAIDVAQACREVDVYSVAVSAGYVCAEPRTEFYQEIDAANIDLKAFTESFYHQLTSGHLEPVLDTLRYIYHETKTWLEITYLVIPDENDSEQEINDMTQWVTDELGPNVPIHFSAFHPDWKMPNHAATPKATLIRAREIAIQNGLHFVYTGNVQHRNGDTTFCPQCRHPVIQRDWYAIAGWDLTSQGCCPRCNAKIAGRFESQPGNWGRRRLPVQLSA